MLNDIIKKENDLTAGIVSEYEKAISDTEKAISEVEEKYKKLAEEETKNLNIELTALKIRLTKWKDIIDVGPRLTNTKTDDEEPKITDTVFPENNEQPCNGTEETKEEAESFEESDTVASVDGDDWGEPNDWN